MNVHLSSQFDADLDAIRASLTRMGGLVEEQVRTAMGAFVGRDLSLIERVVAREAEVNALEVELDDACTHLIARRQPTAIDLRMVMGVGKVVTDLERIGDEAKKVAKAKRKLLERESDGAISNLVGLARLGEEVADMLNEVLDAFVRLDAGAAMRVVIRDQDIDRQFRAIFRQLVTYMMEDPRTISTALDVVFVAKSIERMGDHTKNIAEQVIYIAKGRDVRHLDLEAKEQGARGE